jgi:hypothetical protein
MAPNGQRTFDFIVLKPVADLMPGGAGTFGNSLTMQASAVMRNEQ